MQAEARAQRALGAGDELAAADLALGRAGAREAERGTRARAPAGRDQPGTGAEGVEAAHEGARDPAVSLEQVAADGEVVGGRRHAVGQLALGAVVIDRAAARRAPHEPHTEATAGRHVHVTVERLALAGRDRRRVPGEEPNGGWRGAGVAPAPERLVDGHVGGAVARLGHEEPPGRHGRINSSRGKYARYRAASRVSSGIPRTAAWAPM